MTNAKLDRTRKLRRFRKFAEDNAAVALQSVTRRLQDATEVRELATERVEGLSRWKVLTEEARFSTATYEHALEIEGSAMSEERQRIVEEGLTREQHDRASTSYQSAVNATRVVDRRQDCLFRESIARQEHAEADAMSDLWLAMRVNSYG